MQELEKIKSKKLLNSLMSYIALVIILVVVLVVVSVSLERQQRDKAQQEKYNRAIDSSLQHISEHSLREFTHKARRLIEIHNVKKYVKEQNREALYAALKPKFDLLKEETPELELIHVHLANGDSLLRVHKPEMFGDNIATLRPMLQDIHKNKKLIDGYETGVFANVYRIISPIFDEDGSYLGALEVGLSPSYILRKIEDINGFKGVYFIKERKNNLLNDGESEHKRLEVDGYTLQHEIEPELDKLSRALAKKENTFYCENLNYEGVHYLTHLVRLTDFEHKENIKMVFFQQTPHKDFFLNKEQLLIYFGIVIVLLLSLVAIYRAVKAYENEVVDIFTGKIKLIEELKSRMELAVSGTNDGLWDWDLKNSNVYFSPRFKEMLGFKDEELENNFETWQSRVHPDDLSATLQNIKRAHENKEAEYNNIHRLKHKDGSWVWILDRGETIFDEDNRAIRMIGLHTDITQLKELEQELKNAKSLFELFMNNAPYMVLIKNEKQEILYENIASTKEYGFLKKMFQEEIDLLSQKAVKESTAERLLEACEDEEEYAYRGICFSIDQHNGRVYTGEIYINISAQKLLAKELDMKNDILIAQSRHAEMGEMISMIAHQWRQPLGVISMNVNNVLVDIELDSLEIESLRKELSSVSKQTLYLSKTIDDFRNFFMPDREQNSVFVRDVFQSALEIIGRSLENNNIIIKSSFSDESKVSVFEGELQQVFINLLKNAKEAMQSNSIQEKEIQVKIYETQSSVLAQVCDNAGGISQELQKRIFEPYFSTKSDKNGTGLGLYMSKIIVEKHNAGTLHVENVDDGACFTLSIPKQHESSE